MRTAVASRGVVIGIFRLRRSMRQHGLRSAPLEISGARIHKAIPGSILSVIKGAPHGFNLSHAAEFNKALLAFLVG